MDDYNVIQQYKSLINLVWLILLTVDVHYSLDSCQNTEQNVLPQHHHYRHELIFLNWHI